MRCVYEAGPCGYVLQRYLSANRILCEVAAPALIPKKAGGRVKTDRRDARKLGRLYRAGELTMIYISKEEDESVRDLTRLLTFVRKRELLCQGHIQHERIEVQAMGG